MRRALIPEVHPEKVKSHRFGEYATRFVFGALIALIAGLVGMKFGPKVGGVLLGFPALLPATLTLIQRTEGKEEASVDSVGAFLGALALIVFAIIVSVAVTTWGVVWSLVVALLIWLGVAVGLFFLVALAFEREPAPP